MIYATYNIHHNSIDIYTYAGCFLRIDCNKAEEGLKITPCSECALNALAIDEPCLVLYQAILLTFVAMIFYLAPFLSSKQTITIIFLSKNKRLKAQINEPRVRYNTILHTL